MTLSRDMREITQYVSTAKTVTFPRTVKKVDSYAFYQVGQLRAIVVNEGLK